MPRTKLIPLSLCLILAACASASPEDVQMSNNMCSQGKILLAEGKTSDARDLYASATTRDADNARAWNGLGVANDLMGKQKQAEDAYRHALDLTPDDLTALNNLAHMYLTTGRAEEAVRLLAPHENDTTATPTLLQNLAASRRVLANAADAADEANYADLGSFPTEGMAQAHIKEARNLMGDDAAGVTFTVVPEVKISGGTPVFTAKATGKPVQGICDTLNPLAIPCVPYGK